MHDSCFIDYYHYLIAQADILENN